VAGLNRNRVERRAVASKPEPSEAVEMTPSQWRREKGWLFEPVKAISFVALRVNVRLE